MAPSARNGEEKTQQRGAAQRPRHPHHRSATTGTNPQRTTVTVTNATDPRHNNHTARTNGTSQTVTDTTCPTLTSDKARLTTYDHERQAITTRASPTTLPANIRIALNNTTESSTVDR